MSHHIYGIVIMLYTSVCILLLLTWAVISKSSVRSFSVTGRLALSLMMGSVGPFPLGVQCASYRTQNHWTVEITEGDYDTPTWILFLTCDICSTLWILWTCHIYFVLLFYLVILHYEVYTGKWRMDICLSNLFMKFCPSEMDHFHWEIEIYLTLIAHCLKYDRSSNRSKVHCFDWAMWHICKYRCLSDQ